MKVKTTLLSALPIFLLLTALTGAVIFFPDTKDIRNRAADPAIFNAPATPTPPQDISPTLVLTPTITTRDNTACTELYRPVCGRDGLTYESACDAQNAGIPVAYSTSCVVINDSPTPYSAPQTR